MLEAIATSPGLLVSGTVVLGLVVGSFLTVVAHRLPLMMEREWRRHCAELAGEAPPAEPPLNLVVPRSRCPGCGRAIRAVENIPLASFLALRGRCPGCGRFIGWRYPAIELASAALAGIAAWRFGLSPALGAALVYAWALLALTAIDLERQLLPDQITLPLLWAGLLWNLGPWGFVPLADAVAGAAAGYLFLWGVYHAFRLLTGKEGMGYGDFKLLAAIGAWTGWQMLPLVVLGASLIGALVGGGLIAAGRRRREVPIPFGPFLAGAGWIALLWGEALTAAYLRWTGLV